MSLITISSGDTHLTIAPHLGHDRPPLANCRRRRLRMVSAWRNRPIWSHQSRNVAVSAGALFRTDPPWPFTIDGRRIVLRSTGRQNSTPSTAMAGRPLASVETDGRQARVDYRHAEDAWPWAYRAQQTYRLDGNRLRIEMSVTNEANTPMPAGIGPHPYFVRTPRARVTARISHVWLADSENLPTDLVPPEPLYDLRAGLVPSRQAIDHLFAGWDQRP
jgi:aldose 1-epimerase